MKIHLTNLSNLLNDTLEIAYVHNAAYFPFGLNNNKNYLKNYSMGTQFLSQQSDIFVFLSLAFPTRYQFLVFILASAFFIPGCFDFDSMEAIGTL